MCAKYITSIPANQESSDLNFIYFLVSLTSTFIYVRGSIRSDKTETFASRNKVYLHILS
jgi:hypothetical protein